MFHTGDVDSDNARANPTPTEPVSIGAVGTAPDTDHDVRLFGDEPETGWKHVSPRLMTARTLVLSAWLAPVLAAGVAVAVTVSPWFWIVVGIVVVAWIWGLWLIRRQVPVITFAELDDELVIRRGRMFRSLSSIPYGRLQYVDMQSGPLERRFGLASLTINTASMSTAGTVPGLPIAEAEALRDRLSARGESQRAGL